MSENTVRPPSELRLGSQARKALAELTRWQRRADEAAEHITGARDELTAMHRRACERFGRSLPPDALLLDVLELIEVEDGDVWRWKGRRNNKGLATVMIRRPARKGSYERSLVRYLALELGVIDEGEWGVLYPANGDADDVNPWHRTLRRAGEPVGNPTRYGFDLDGEWVGT